MRINKKIGILTYHAADNYGSVLQAYALNQFLLENFSEECYVINYQPTSQKKMYALYFENNSFKNILKNIYIFFVLRTGRTNRIDSFAKFRKNRMKLFPYDIVTNVESLELDHFDAVVCGSDQIWNVRVKDYNPFYMLNDIEVPCKISYAASMGGVDLNLSENEAQEIKQALSSYQKISVRENVAKQMLEKCDLKNIYNHVDPTFLISVDHWKQIMSQRIISGEYIFFYSVDYNEESVEIARWYGKKLGIPVVYMNTSWKSYFIKGSGIQCSKVSGVEDFLSLIYYSKAVLSGSFHGTAFSIIFNKPFYRIQRNRNNSTIVDDRVRSLFASFEVENREITTENFEDKFNDLFAIEFETINENIQKAQNKAKEYFENCFLTEGKVEEM